MLSLISFENNHLDKDTKEKRNDDHDNVFDVNKFNDNYEKLLNLLGIIQV